MHLDVWKAELLKRGWRKGPNKRTKNGIRQVIKNEYHYHKLSLRRGRRGFCYNRRGFCYNRRGFCDYWGSRWGVFFELSIQDRNQRQRGEEMIKTMHNKPIEHYLCGFSGCNLLMNPNRMKNGRDAQKGENQQFSLPRGVFSNGCSKDSAKHIRIYPQNELICTISTFDRSLWTSRRIRKKI